MELTKTRTEVKIMLYTYSIENNRIDGIIINNRKKSKRGPYLL